LVYGEADEGDQIRQDAFSAGAFDFGLFKRGIGLPELGFVPQVRGLLDGLGQFFDVIERKPAL